MDHSEAVRLMATERYLLGEMSPDVREAFEGHLFECEECALDVVFLRHRGAEQRHETIAGKLRRGASVAIHLGKAGGQK